MALIIPNNFTITSLSWKKKLKNTIFAITFKDMMNHRGLDEDLEELKFSRAYYREMDERKAKFSALLNAIAIKLIDDSCYVGRNELVEPTYSVC